MGVPISRKAMGANGEGQSEQGAQGSPENLAGCPHGHSGTTLALPEDLPWLCWKPLGLSRASSQGLAPSQEKIGPQSQQGLPGAQVSPDGDRTWRGEDGAWRMWWSSHGVCKMMFPPDHGAPWALENALVFPGALGVPRWCGG